MKTPVTDMDSYHSWQQS